jgi:hypothetical protein
MKIFIDFDDVIFNTKRFKYDFKNMFFEHGVSNEIFDKYYNDPNDKKAIKTFDPWAHIARINKEISIDVEKLKSMVNEYVVDMSRYVFDDVVGFINNVGAENLILISFGEKEFQTKKIVNSGIADLIKNFVITNDSKAAEVKRIINGDSFDKSEKFFFLDDRIEQVDEIKKKFPDIITVFVKRPEGRYQDMQKDECCDHEVHNLKEAEKIIKSTL